MCRQLHSAYLPSGQQLRHLTVLPSRLPPGQLIRRAAASAAVWRSRALQHDPSALRGAPKGQPVVTGPQLGPWQPGSTKKHWPLRPILVPSGQSVVVPPHLPVSYSRMLQHCPFTETWATDGGRRRRRALCRACRHALVVAAKLLLLSRRHTSAARGICTRLRDRQYDVPTFPHRWFPNTARWRVGGHVVACGHAGTVPDCRPTVVQSTAFLALREIAQIPASRPTN